MNNEHIYRIGRTILVCLALCLAGCHSSENSIVALRQVKIDSVYIYKTDTLKHYHFIKDTLLVHDSVSVYQKGDTIFRDRWKVIKSAHYESDSVLQARVDSLMSAKVDSIPYPVEVIKYKYRIPWYIKFFSILCIICLVVLSIRFLLKKD